ncbi:MAG: ABC transporter ATP-binding protein [Chloroflexota bacterium]|nr:ABC transporter ATP-binding protein [Chloroflexota bacterium]
MLEVRDIHTSYGGSYILQGVSLAVDEAKVVAVLGRNGVGKTTLMRSVCGFTPPRQGKVFFKGRDITHLPAYRIARMGISHIPQGRRIFVSLTTEENLTVSAKKGATVWTMDKIFSVFPMLKERLHSKGGQLSGGEQQMLASARALAADPGLVLMDEPTEGLAPLLVRELGRLVKELKERGQSILLVEQNLPFALALADWVYVMSKGRIVHESVPQELWENQEVKSRYLGF